MKEITVTRAETGQRFDRYLLRYMPNTTAGFLHKMLRKKNIKLNGGKASGSEKLQEGDRIQIYFSEETLEKFIGQEESTARRLSAEQKKLRREVRLLYATDDVLVFHKPAGMLTQKARKEDDSLNDYLLEYCREHGMAGTEEESVFRPSVANRLDRNTSGIVLCGITTAGLQTLSRLLRERSLEKYYLCIVCGQIRGSRKVKGWLVKDERRNTVTLRRAFMEGAAPVETWYEALAVSAEATLLKVRLITGKSHQIRAHLASEGHPVLGDYKYGNRQDNDRLKRASGINYQLLHSYELRIPEQVASVPEAMWGFRITDPPPEPFVRAMEHFGLSMKNDEKIQNNGKR